MLNPHNFSQTHGISQPVSLRSSLITTKQSPIVRHYRNNSANIMSSSVKLRAKGGLCFHKNLYN
jgi:hypothetical protein